MSTVDQIMKAIYDYKLNNTHNPKELHLGRDSWRMLASEYTYGMLVFKQDKLQQDSFAGLTVVIDDYCEYKIEVK